MKCDAPVLIRGVRFGGFFKGPPVVTIIRGKDRFTFENADGYFVELHTPLFVPTNEEFNVEPPDCLLDCIMGPFLRIGRVV